MSSLKEEMREGLAEIQCLRELETGDARLGPRLDALRQWQGERLAATYEDLARQTRFRAAIRFFREDLYGGGDFAARDRDFERIFPIMVRMLPERVLRTVNQVIALHRLSERLDHAMCEHLSLPLGLRTYVRAWQAVGRQDARARQIGNLSTVAYALERIVRKGVIRGLLRVMHGPAHAAGFGAMQGFLERGFDAFRAMGGAAEFVQVVETRETMIMRNLFAGSDEPFAPWVTGQELVARISAPSAPQASASSR